MRSRDIKEYGFNIGYSKVGITSADSFAEYVDEVVSRGDKYDILNFTTTNPVHGAIPNNIMPEAKSVIVLIWDYFQNDFPEELKKMIGKIYLARCYNPLPGMLAHSRLQLMKDYLSNNGCMVNSSIGIPARWAATQAGVTTFGRNNFAYAGDSGSYIVINTIVVDMELDYDEPTMESKCPPNCRACMNACPTKAIYEPFKLEPKKCIAFNNWMTQDGRGSISSFIPYELREAIGCKIHGCDICQDVCPLNQKKLKAPKTADRYIEQIATDIKLPAILNMTDDFFMSRVKPIMYNYIKDKRYLMRNAAIAMGNSKDEDYVKDLEIALKNPDEMIREYAVWALGKIGGKHAKIVLERHLLKEPSDNVKQAINKVFAQG
jgi:epoxyqueuosine reductase